MELEGEKGSVGADDAFSAGFLYTYLSGYGVSKAISIASILGTYLHQKRVLCLNTLINL